MQTETNTFRLSPCQKQLWLAQPVQHLSRVSGTIDLQGLLDRAILHDALQRVISQHEMLRTTFLFIAGMTAPFQQVHPQMPLPLHQRDFCGLPAQEQATRVRALAQQESSHPYEVAGQPLLATLIALAPDRHVLLLSLPALCVDTVSWQIIVRDLARAYQQALAIECPFDDTLPYIDVSEWQHGLLEADDAEALAGNAYWSRQTDLWYQETTVLPFEKTPPPSSPVEHKSIFIDIEDETLTRWRTALTELGVTLPVALLTGWHMLLARLTDSRAAAPALLLDERKYDELRHTVGLLTRSIPLCCPYQNDFQVSEMLQRCQQEIRQATAWQEYYSAPANMCSFGFQYEEAWPAVEGAGVAFALGLRVAYSGNFKIVLDVSEKRSGLILQLRYNAALYKKSSIRFLAEQLQATLTHALASPQTAVSALRILSQTQYDMMIHTFSTTHQASVPPDTIHRLFEAQVRRTPSAPAVVFEEQQLTYEELNTQANALATLLRLHGAGPEVLIGICLERSLTTLIAILGVLKAGSAYVPLDPQSPPARLAWQSANLPILLSQASLAETFSDYRGKLLLAEDWPRQEKVEEWSGCQAAPGNLAYVIYTSGSSGLPKGVAVTHQNLVNYVHALNREFSFSAGLKFTTTAAVTADLGHTALFPALLTGGCLHLLSYATITNGPALGVYMQQHAIDMLKIVPSHLSALLSVSSDVLPRRYLVLGGEPFSLELFTRLVKLQPRCEIINHYGPTEATVGSLIYRVEKEAGEALLTLTIPIGRPLLNTQVYILDLTGELTPPGMAGELMLGGSGLARGYWQDPAQTAERFLPHPFSALGGERLYRTGDRARFLPDGRVEFLGRLDEQVKIRGFRVEPGEVTALLQQHAAVREAIVFAQEDQQRGQHLVAALVPVSPATFSLEEIKRFLREHLPVYLHPAEFIILDRLLLTRNGKIDRLALQAMAGTRPQGEAVAVLPKTETEFLLATIWQELLHLETVGVHDNFFERGGHSLLLVQLQSKIQETFSVTLSTVDLFTYPTISSLAAHLGQEQQPEVSSQETLDHAESRRDAIAEMRRRQTRKKRGGDDAQ